jgi:hypothetical protein
VDSVLGKDRDEGTDGDAQEPVPEDLCELEFKIISKIDKFSLQNLKHMPATAFSSEEKRKASDVIFYHINVPFSSFYSMAFLNMTALIG